MEEIKKGKLIVIEGACDGMGKTTQYALLRNRLIEDKEDVISHHFPSYHTYHGEPVSRYLNGEMGTPQELSPYFVNSLYAVDRGIVWYTEFKKYFEEGKTILLDRYTTSSIIYQSALIQDIEAKKAFIDYITDFEYNKIGIKVPDKVIFLHAPFDLVTKIRNARKSNDGISNDIHERNLEFMRRVYENAMFVADYLSWSMVKCNDDDRMLSIDEIHQKVYTLTK